MKNARDLFAPKYIDPMSDFGFKKIFKESGRKELLIRPLNAIFGLDIADLEIGESERQGETPEDRSACFDLFCTAADGKQFIVEVQRIKQPFFVERAIYYSAFPITGSAQRGQADGVSWDYNFPPVFFLGLLDFDFRGLHGPSAAGPNPNSDQFIHRFSLRDDQTGERMTESLRFAFLEIRRFDKAKEDCGNFEEQFLYLMKNLPIFVETPALWEEEEPYFRAMLDAAEYAQMSREQKRQYREEMRRDWDYKNTMDYAVAQGKEEGIAEGLVKGKAEGQAEEKQSIARRMLADGLSAEVVAKYTDLTEEQILGLAMRSCVQ